MTLIDGAGSSGTDFVARSVVVDVLALMDGKLPHEIISGATCAPLE